MISILLGIIIGIIHYYSKPFCNYCYNYRVYLISFSGGVFLTYVIFKLLPLFSLGAVQISLTLYLTILFGFIFFYLVEKYIYQHHSRKRLVAELELEDSIISFAYHFIGGMFIATFTRISLREGILFSIPLLFQTAVRTLPFDPTHSKTIQIILSSSTLFGILFIEYIYTSPSLLIYHTLLGFIIGSLLFVVTRHSLPFGKKGKPMFFTIGVIIYTLLILLLTNFKVII